MNKGKDIKCFTDLPPDIRKTIDRISDTPQEHSRRTAIAIKYQYLFRIDTSDDIFKGKQAPDETHEGFIDRLYSPEHIEHCRDVENWAERGR